MQDVLCPFVRVAWDHPALGASALLDWDLGIITRHVGGVKDGPVMN